LARTASDPINKARKRGGGGTTTIKERVKENMGKDRDPNGSNHLKVMETRTGQRRQVRNRHQKAELAAKKRTKKKNGTGPVTLGFKKKSETPPCQQLKDSKQDD